MNKVLLAVAFLAVGSAPVFAHWSKTQSKGKQIYAKQTSQQWKAKTESERRRKFEETYVDPYWEPCDYTTSYGTNGCGGD